MRLLLFLLFSSFLPSFHAQSCTTVYGESARCDVATACPAQGGTSGYVAQDEKLCPTISGVTKVCCLNFKLTDAMQVYDATAAPWQPAALQDWQQSAMNFFPDVMQKFACMYRNIPYVSSSTNCGTTISLTAVAEYYQNLSHQIDALNYLQNVVEGWLITYPDGMNQAWLIYIRMIRGYRNTLDPMKWIKPTSTPIPSTPPIGTCRKAAAATYTLSQNGLNVIKHFESWFACCYTDSVGVRTVGYGHACHVRTNLNDGSGCGPGLNQCSGCISRSLGESILAKDMLVYSSCVKSAIKVPITQNQYDALVSFAFNVGCQGMATSSLVTLLNQGSLTKAQAQYQLSRWHSGCLEGLKRRRYAEALLFNSCDAIGSFPCSEKGCSISYGYNKCASNCQYCSACGGCTSSSTSETSKAAAFSTFAAPIMETCPIGEYAEIDKPCIVSGDMASSYQCTTAGMTSNTTTIGTCTNNQLIPSYNTSLPLETCTSSTSGIISYTRFDRYDGLDIDELNHISIDPILHARITIRRGYDGQIPNVRLITYASTQQLAQAVYVHTISSSQDGGMEGLLLKADGEAHSFTDTGGNSGRPINTGSRSSGSLSAFSHLATALVTGVTLSRSPSWGLLTGAAASTLYMSQVDAAPSCTTYTEMTIVLNPIDYAFAMTAINDGRLIVNATIVTTNPNTPSQPDAIDCLDAAVTYVFPTLCASFQPSSTDTTSITALSSNQPMAAISQGPLLLSNAFLYYNPTLSPHQTCAFNWLQSALGNTPEIRTFACEYRNKIATSTDPTCGEPINLINAATSYNPSIVHQQNAITTLQSKLEIRTEIWSTFVTYYRQQQICIDWIIRVDGRCGIKFDNAGCSIRDDTCCSVGGWCGDTDDHCNPTKGGYDWKQGRPTIATTTTTTPPTIPAATQTITGNACFSNHPSNGKPGVCISSSTCTAAGGITAKGLCPGDANILCCGGDNVNIKLVVNQDVCGSYASSPTFQIAGNDGTYTVVKILRAHLTDPSAYDAAPTDRDNTLKANVACHYDKMRAAAAQDGVSIKISSGFRTVARQQYFYRCSNAGCCCCNGCALAAPPGTSNHGYGIAMDLNTNCGSQDNISGCRSSSPVYRWLAANAAAYGFRRAVVSEPWHWEYHGVGTVKTSYT